MAKIIHDHEYWGLASVATVDVHRLDSDAADDETYYLADRYATVTILDPTADELVGDRLADVVEHLASEWRSRVAIDFESIEDVGGALMLKVVPEEIVEVGDPC